MTDEQPTQPLTDAELSRIREHLASDNVALHDAWLADDALHLLTEVDRLRAALSGARTALINAHEAGMSLGQDVERLQSALTALGRNEQAAANRSLELQDENERLRLEAAQMESGARIAMNAGVTVLQEVKRLEGVVAGLKAINDRMAEDRLRLVDERDRLQTETAAHVRHLADIRKTLNKADAHGQPEASGVWQLARCAESLRKENERLEDERETDAGVLMAHRAQIERLQSERVALMRKLGLDWGPDEFGDLGSVPTPVNTDKGGIVVNMEPPRGGSSADNFAVGFSAGLRRGRQGR